MFEHLISVNGVGPKAALSILSAAPPERFALAVVTGDTKLITKAQGVGPKLAQRIILELKDKIKTEEAIDVQNAKNMEEKVQNEEDTEELIQALQVLGYRRYEINKILSKVKATTLEDKIKEALQYLAK